MGLHTSGIVGIFMYTLFFVGLLWILRYAKKDVESFQTAESMVKCFSVFNEGVATTLSAPANAVFTGIKTAYYGSVAGTCNTNGSFSSFSINGNVSYRGTSGADPTWNARYSSGFNTYITAACIR